MSAAPDIVEKIKKLLRLARSSNRHEAELALARALEMARAHQIEIDGLNPDAIPSDRDLTHRDTVAEARLSYDKRYALALVRLFFRVSTVEVQCLRVVRGVARLGVRVMFVGTRSDIEIALYVYAFIVRHFSRCWRAVSHRFRNRHAYVYGMFIGLRSKLHGLQDSGANGTELVLAEQNAYIARTIGKTTSKEVGGPDHLAQAAANAGFTAGMNTTIHTALKASTERQLALAG